jgi:predicted nucleic acid-binding protein
MILVDSSVWIDFFTGKATPACAWLVSLLQDLAPIAIADLVLFEVLRGFRHDREYLAARRVLGAVPLLDIGGMINVTRAAALDRGLRAVGYTVRSAIDLLQANYCLAHGHALLHRDADFDVIERVHGLQVWRG